MVKEPRGLDALAGDGEPDTGRGAGDDGSLSLQHGGLRRLVPRYDKRYSGAVVAATHRAFR
jgi:hypothetical protein